MSRRGITGQDRAVQSWDKWQRLGNFNVVAKVHREAGWRITTPEAIAMYLQAAFCFRRGTKLSRRRRRCG